MKVIALGNSSKYPAKDASASYSKAIDLRCVTSLATMATNSK